MNMYERIGKIAHDNWDQRISFGELAAMLNLPKPWHAGQQVERAWHYFERRGDTGTCSAISRVFWSKYSI